MVALTSGQWGPVHHIMVPTGLRIEEDLVQLVVVLRVEPAYNENQHYRACSTHM